MKRLIMVVFFLLVTVPAFAAAPLRVYVAEFNAVGVSAKDDVKVMLQSLLASRLGSDKLLSVATVAEADVVVNGTYISIGSQYNIDAVAKTVGGQTVTRTFVQGEGAQESLFSAVPKLADKLSSELVRRFDTGELSGRSVASVAAAVSKPAAADILRPGTRATGDLRRVPQGDIVRPQALYRGSPKSGEIKRLDGMYNLLSVGPVEASGKRLIFMAQDHSVVMLREGEGNPITGFTLGVTHKIYGLDYVDGDGDGTAELYVTVMNGGEVESQVWELKNNRLVKVADKIGFFFRAVGLAGGAVKLYAQEQGRDKEQFYGQVYEVTRKGSKIIKKTMIPMPRYGNIFSFNQFKNEQGELLMVVYHDENYLVVYDKDLKEVWRSNDVFGGSELYYQVEDLGRFQLYGDKYRWYFRNQRIQVTSRQEVLVGKNDGFFVLGNARMYKRGAVYSLYWNGAALEEVWRTKDTQNYMPDFWFDEKMSELLLLQLTAREDTITRSKGASALQIKKVE